MKRRTIQKLTRLSILLAIGVILNYMEHVLLPTAFIAPGVKLGLANTIGLIVLFYFTPLEFVYIGFLRVLLTALFTGFGFAFLISLGGWALATLLVLILYSLNKLSLFGLSMVSAVGHGLGQLIVVTSLYETIYMINYLPILVISGLIGGLIIAKISQQILIRLPKDNYAESL